MRQRNAAIQPISIECCETKSKVISIGSQSELKMKGGGKASKLTEGQENANDQVVFVWSFSSDCLRRRRNFSWPATKKSESKQMQSRTTL